MDLSSFIGQSNVLALERAYREKAPLIHPEGSPGRFKALWSDWELDAISRFTLLPESDTFRLFTRGKQVPAAAYRDRAGTTRLSTISQLWASGTSINFARLELYSNPVLALIRSLEAAFSSPVRVHFFTTPGRSQGLGVHADHGDFLVLQVRGEKTWDFYPGSDQWRPAGPDDVAARLRAHPPETVTLSEGGWLYLPKGVYHEVRNNAAEPSTHFTIGFHDLTWAMLLEGTLDTARRSLPALKDAVALGGLQGERQDEARSRLLALLPYVEQTLQSSLFGLLLAPEELVPRDRLEAVEGASRFSWAGTKVRIKMGGDRVELHLPYRAVPLALRAEFEPVITHMLKAGTFSPSGLPMDPEIARLLCKFLANVGVLVFAC